MTEHSGIVLVVDDEAPVRQLAARVLRRHGYTVLEAEDAPSALERVEAAGPIGLLLTDVVLPGMKGDELARTLREKDPALAVVFMSGYEEDELTGMGIGSVGAAYLTKPFTADVLMLMVEGTLDG